jgi:23S rRNA (cytidine1920-2'-O)/16S rRNA (cytidine1409-2'-O)-methyltransferase
VILEERIDKILLARGLVSSRARAEEIIKNDGVIVNGKLINKTGKKIPLDSNIELIAEELPWVSRGALKLLHAFETWNSNVEHKIFIDIGASTGGFTEVLLSMNVSKVYCVDVGKDQLHPRIKNDKRIVNLEKTHIRELTTQLVPERVHGCVIDVSFISLTKVFPFIHSFLQENAEIYALVKPQFEVGKANIGKGGIVKNKKLHQQCIEDLFAVAKVNQLTYIDHIPSPILGKDGNHEYLMYLKKSVSLNNQESSL